MPDNLEKRKIYLPNTLEKQELSSHDEVWGQFCDISESLNAKPNYKIPIDSDPRPRKTFCQRIEEEGMLYSSPFCIIL